MPAVWMSSYCALRKVPQACVCWRDHSAREFSPALSLRPWTAPPRDWGDYCEYLYNHILDQIINSNSLGAEILRHLTFVSFSLLYFLMSLF